MAFAIKIEMIGDDDQYPRWECLDCAGDVPQCRSGHTCALHKNRYLYIFGGFDGSQCFDDLYELDIDLRTWRHVEASGHLPAARASHSAVSDELAGMMYIFGGSGSHFGYTNKKDLCEFCYETRTWRLLLDPVEDIPSARYGQSMVAYREWLYVWGGTHGTNYPQDMFRFDLCGKKWNQVRASGFVPCGRYKHQAMVKDDVMYIVGGSGINRYGDVFAFNFLSNSWDKICCRGEDLSDGRYAHSAVLHDGCIYLYGGNDGNRHDGLQQLDLETQIWTRAVVNGDNPPGRDFHAACLRQHSMIVFGGSNGQHRHNDVFEFHMSEEAPLCTLSSDFGAFFDLAQMDEAVQMSCDVFLAADDSETVHGVYCHSHMLLARCPKLFEITKDPSTHQLVSSAPMSPTKVRGKEDWASRQRDEEVLDALLRSVGTNSPTSPRSHTRAIAHNLVNHLDPSAVNSRCTKVPVNIPFPILLQIVRFFYAGCSTLCRLPASHLFSLFTTSTQLDAHRLAGLALRQLKLSITLDNVLQLLRASTRAGSVAQPVQDVCKHFFLANYSKCAELQECEALDPKLLCEIMRLHNFRTTSAAENGDAATMVSSVGSPSSARDNDVVKCSFPQPSEEGTTNNNVVLPVPPDTLAIDLSRLVDDRTSSDLEVDVQGEVIHAHKFVLVARSSYFASRILVPAVDIPVGRIDIPTESPMTASAFRAFLRFLYAGDKILQIISPYTAMYLVDACSSYGLSNARLKHFCEACVRDSFSEAHVLELLEASSRLGASAIKRMALDFIVGNFSAVCAQSGLEALDKNLLLDIIRVLMEKTPEHVGRFGSGFSPELHLAS